MADITNKEELKEAKEKLENLVDTHKYHQMLAGSSKIPPDPEMLWLHKAIELFEKDNPLEPNFTTDHSQGYPSD